jgi:hypothetical protein
MRSLVALSSLAFLSAPALAQTPPAPQSRAERADDIQIPSELTDPAMADTLGKMLGTLTKAMMDVPIGEMQAAMEGRAATAADKSRTIRDMAGRDPNFERKVEQQVAASVPRMQAGMKAMAASMPAMIGALEKAAEGMEREIDRATANLPQPGYPRR